MFFLFSLAMEHTALPRFLNGIGLRLGLVEGRLGCVSGGLRIFKGAAKAKQPQTPSNKTASKATKNATKSNKHGNIFKELVHTSRKLGTATSGY